MTRYSPDRIRQAVATAAVSCAGRRDQKTATCRSAARLLATEDIFATRALSPRSRASAIRSLTDRIRTVAGWSAKAVRSSQDCCHSTSRVSDIRKPDLAQDSTSSKDERGLQDGRNGPGIPRRRVRIRRSSLGQMAIHARLVPSSLVDARAGRRAAVLLRPDSVRRRRFSAAGPGIRSGEGSDARWRCPSRFGGAGVGSGRARQAEPMSPATGVQQPARSSEHRNRSAPGTDPTARGSKPSAARSRCRSPARAARRSGAREPSAGTATIRQT